MEPPDLGGKKPAFLSKETAESVPYVGADSSPVFDDEILPPKEEINPRPELPEAEEKLGKGPTQGYETRWREIARLHAYGYTNNQIAHHLGYSAPGISLALNKPFVQQEIAKHRAQFMDHDAVNIMKDTARYAAMRLQKSVLDPSSKEGHDAAKFVMEKVTGKAKQEVNVEIGTINFFTDLAKQMAERGELGRDVTLKQISSADATESEVQVDDKWDNWIDHELG